MSEVHTGCMAQGADVSEDGVTLRWKDSKDVDQSIDVDKVLVTVGRRPNTKNWGLEEMGIKMEMIQDVSSQSMMDAERICLEPMLLEM